MQNSSLPDPFGSAAAVAAADQHGAAVEHARRVAANTLPVFGGHLLVAVDCDGPFTAAMIDTVTENRLRTCRHFFDTPGLQPLCIPAPQVLTCPQCFVRGLAAVFAGGLEVCQGCGSRRDDVGLLITQSGLYVAAGELCPGCVSGELHAV